MVIYSGIITTLGSFVPRKLDSDISTTQITFVKLQSYKCTLVIVEIDISIQNEGHFLLLLISTGSPSISLIVLKC